MREEHWGGLEEKTLQEAKGECRYWKTLLWSV